MDGWKKAHEAHEARAFFALLVESELSRVKRTLTAYYQLTNLFNNEVTIMGCKKPKKK